MFKCSKNIDIIFMIIDLFAADKYCQIVIAEGGLKIMSDLLEEHRKLESQGNQPGVIPILAQTVISQCVLFMKHAVESQ